MAFTACEKEDDLNPTSMSREDLVSTLTLSNGLRITEFVEDGADMTSDFNPYVFDFETNGTVTATKGSETINGTYSVFLDDGRKELRMNFPMTSALYELSDDWYFISANETGLRFADGVDVIHFQNIGASSNPPSGMIGENLMSSLTSVEGLKISKFIEEGVNMTSDFQPYLFFFDANGSVTATSTGADIVGTYSVFQDDGRTELRMNFPINSALYELNDDWYFISASTTGLRFAEGGDVLWFQTAGSGSNPPPPSGSGTTRDDLLSLMTSPNGLKITKFTEEGLDMTSWFNPYLFVFQSNGTVTASKTGEIVNGTYSVFTDDGRVELRMSFPMNSALQELRDDWYFIKVNGNVLRFADAGDVLRFELQ